MEKKLNVKYEALLRRIGEYGSAAVAFSGGVDSTFLLKVCHDVLGDSVLAVTARSETYPERELEQSRDLAKDMGANAIRCSHYPRDPSFYNACDEIGICCF